MEAARPLTALRTRAESLTWVQRSLILGGFLAVLWSVWSVPWWSLPKRVFRDLVVFVALPGLLAVSHGRHIGWRVDRRAVRNTLLLAAFIFPFYLVGSSLPSVRAYYPMWETSLAFADFLPHTVGQLLVVVAAETYYRGLLCVGVRDIGIKSIFISPILYAFHHVGKPPIELLLAAPTDVLFGAVDYESDSILPSVVAHGFGLSLLDWLVLHDPIVPTATVLTWLSWLPLPL